MSANTLTEPHPYPTRRDEAWRYAPHRLLANLTFGHTRRRGPSPLPWIVDELPVPGGPRVVVVNGMVDLSHSDLGASGGVMLTAEAPPERDGRPVGGVGGKLSEPADVFEACHDEYGRETVFIDVAPGTTLDTPIHLVNVAVPAHETNMACSTVAVRLNAGSSACVVDTRVGIGPAFGGSQVRTTIVLEAGSALDHIVVQALPVGQVHLSHVDVDQDRDSTYRSQSFNLGATYGRLATKVALAEPGATVDLSGLYFGTGEQNLDQQISVVHAASGCTSRQSFRGVLDDRSVGTFNASIEVRPGADGSDAAQSNHNLVLSDRAEVNTQPRLEILADEVTCTHGATVGALDEAALFYLRSRGIPAPLARTVLVRAFADQVVDGIDDASVRRWISRRLGHGDA